MYFTGTLKNPRKKTPIWSRDDASGVVNTWRLRRQFLLETTSAPQNPCNVAVTDVTAMGDRAAIEFLKFVVPQEHVASRHAVARFL